jgi:hypothetical protein
MQGKNERQGGVYPLVNVNIELIFDAAAPMQAVF